MVMAAAVACAVSGSARMSAPVHGAAPAHMARSAVPVMGLHLVMGHGFLGPAHVRGSGPVAVHGGPAGFHIARRGFGIKRKPSKTADTSNEWMRICVGDVSLTTGYNLVPESAHTILVRPLFYVKLPTGDEDEGLGTGGLDFGGGLALSKWLGDWMTYGELLHISPEDSDNLDMQEYWSYTFTLGYAATDRLRPEISLVGATNAFKGADDVRSLELALNYWPAGRLRLQGYVSFGLTDASSDFGTGASITIDY